MHNRFEEHQRRCKRRRRKILLGWTALFAALIALAGGAVLYWQEGIPAQPAGVVPVEAPIEAPVVAPQKAAVKEAVPPAAPQKREIPEKPAVKPAAPEPAARERERPTEKEKKRVTEKAEEKRRHAPAVTRRDTPSGQPVVEKELLPKPREKKDEETEKRVETKKPAVKQPPKAKPAKTGGPTEESRLPVTERPAKPVLEVKEVQDLDALVRQYEKYPRYVTALKIAHLYFEKRDYENAALWARKANLIDRDDEEAWVLYAKSEYALGNRERAKRILRLYLDYRDSVKARTLLLSWGKENGKEEEKGR